MPVLKNARHELFAQSRSKGATVDQAHVDAGYKRNRGNAGRLNANESVRERVLEIQGVGAAEAEITAEWVVRQLRDNYLRATGQKGVMTYVTDMMGKRVFDEDTEEPMTEPMLMCDLHAANKALELLGKNLGIFEEKDQGGNQPTVVVQFPL